MSVFLLRAMTRADLPEIVRIEQAAHLHPWSAELLEREFDNAWSRQVVAEDEGRITAYVFFWLIHDEVHVLNVACDPGRRRRGAGRALMREAEAHGLRAGAVLSTLEVRRSNAPAIALYASMGYRHVGTRPRYYQPDGEDALVMLKDLVPRA